MLVARSQIGVGRMGLAGECFLDPLALAAEELACSVAIHRRSLYAGVIRPDDLARCIEVLGADDDFVRAARRHPVRRSGSDVGLPDDALDACAAQQTAEQLCFLLRCDDICHGKPFHV
jgi:hypothetical protein